MRRSVKARLRRMAAAAIVAVCTAALTPAVAHGAPASLVKPAEPAALEALRDTLAASAPVGSVTRIDPASGSIVMSIPGRRTTALNHAIGRQSVAVIVEEGALPVTTLADIYSGTPIETAFQERLCTMGFTAVGNGWISIITAGHCVKDGAGPTDVWFTVGGHNAGGYIGPNIAPARFPGDDWGFIYLADHSPHQPRPYVLKSGQLIHTVRAGDANAGRGGTLGTEGCMTGRTSGTTCGWTLATNVSVTYHQGVVSGLVETNLCSASGDSGAPFFGQRLVYENNQLLFRQYGYGILSGGNTAPCTSSARRSYFQPLREILETTGLTLLT